MQKRFSLFILPILISCLVFSSCQTASYEPEASVQEVPSAQDKQVCAEVRPQDDYYHYINAQWLEQANLEEDGPRVMRMTALQNQINQQLQDDFENLVQSGTDDTTAYLADAITLYRLFTDTEARNKNGINALRPYLEQIESAQTVDEMQAAYYPCVVTGTPAPFKLEVIADPIDPSQNTLVATSPPVYLPHISYYEQGHPQGQAMLKEREFILQNLALLAGMNEEESKQMAADALRFDRKLSEYMQSAGELQTALMSAENYVPFEEFCSNINSIDFKTLVSNLAGEAPNRVKVLDQRFYEDLDSIVQSENLSLIKHWLIAGYLYNNALYLSEEFYGARYAKPDEQIPSQEEDEPEYSFASGAADQGFGFLQANFSTELGRYYSDRYLTPKTKETVENMCRGMIEEYKDRLRENEWMQGATRQKAIEKLEKMTVIVGAVEIENPVTEGLRLVGTEEGGMLLQGVFAVQENFVKNNFYTLNQTNVGLDRVGATLATLKSYEVNAAYIPNINSIVINAAILNEPYYSPSYSDSRNYGGIGAVIGHEISHAFDQTGSRYDCDGTMQNWWTPLDAAEFESRTKKMIDHFDGLPYMGGTIDGTLTITENTADAGGLSVSLEVLERSGKEVDYEEYFRAWAEIWADKATEEEALVRLKTDPHSPGTYRVNRQMILLDAFYSTYHLTESDGMFLPAEQRFQIW